MAQGIFRICLALCLGTTAFMLTGAAREAGEGGKQAKWKIEADTARGTLTTMPTTHPSASEINADPFQLKVGLSAAIEYYSEVIASRQGGWHFLIPTSKGVSLFNLKTGAVEKTLSITNARDFSISPNGDWMTCVRNNVLETWSFKTGKPGIQIIKSNDEVGTPRAVGFKGQNQIMVLRHQDRKNVVKIYDVTNGQVASSFFVNGLAEEDLMPSANGEILVFIDRGKVIFHQTSTGQTLGEVSTEIDSNKTSFSRYRTLCAFSPDGKELALVELPVLMGGKSRFHYMLISAETGAVRQDTMADITMPPNFVNRKLCLSWNPNGQALLLGTHVLDKNTGNILKTGPITNDYIHSRWENASNYLVVDNQSSKATLATVAVSWDEMRKNADIYARGGTGDDIGLPPLTTLSGATPHVVNPAANAGAEWKAPPVPPAPAKGVLSQLNFSAFSDPRPKGVSLFSDTASAFCLTPRSTNCILFSHSGYTSSMIELYGLSDGKKRAGVKVPGIMKLADVSDTGELFVTLSGNQNPRLDVYKLNKSEYRHYFACRPSNTNLDEHFNGNTEVQFVDDGHLLLIQNRNLSLIDIENKAVVWNTTGTMFSDVAFSPDRKTVCAVKSYSQIVFFDPLTGEGNNIIPLDNRHPGQIAFSQDGTLLAVTMVKDGVSTAGIINLKVGRIVTEIPLLQSCSKLRFLSSSHLLVDNTAYSIDLKLPLWMYHNIKTPVGAIEPHECVFFSISEASDGGACKLGAAALPHSKTPLLKDEDIFAWKTPQSVSLQITVVGDDKYRESQIKEWTKKLGEIGVAVDPNSPNILRATSGYTMIDDGEYQGAGQAITRRTPFTTYDISLIVNNQEIWAARQKPPTEPRNGGPRIMRLEIKPGETPQQAMDRLNQPPREVSVIRLPPAVIQKKEFVLPIFTLTPNGVKPVPLARK